MERWPAYLTHIETERVSSETTVCVREMSKSRGGWVMNCVYLFGFLWEKIERGGKHAKEGNWSRNHFFVIYCNNKSVSGQAKAYIWLRNHRSVMPPLATPIAVKITVKRVAVAPNEFAITVAAACYRPCLRGVQNMSEDIKLFSTYFVIFRPLFNLFSVVSNRSTILQ